jgi:hypothetical protein
MQGVYIDEERGKHVITRPSANANMFLNSADRLTSRSYTDSVIAPTLPINDFRLQKPSALSSGLFTRGVLSEVRFPYACPNVNSRNNTFLIQVGSSPTQTVFVAEGWYNGTELAAAIQAQLNILYPFPAPDVPQCTYNSTSNTFTFQMPTGAVPSTLALFPYSTLITNSDPGNLLQVMGFNYRDIDYGIPKQVQQGGYAPLTYTQYVDIVSSKLATYQEVKDGDSSVAGKTDLMVRLYIADDISVFPQTNPAGCRPFLIHRQFKNPKTFRWNNTAFLDYVDLRLLDQYGQPLYVPPATGLPDYQISMLLSED